MPRFVLWVGLVFGIIGLAIMAGGVWSWQSRQAIIDEGVRTTGIVTELDYRSDDEGGGSYYPVVEFRDRSGQPRTYHANSGSNPPSYVRGERVEIVYLTGNPEHALIDDFMGRWMLPVFLLCFGGVFAAIGWTTVYFYSRRKRTIAKLKARGLPVTARFVECFRDTSTTVNGRHPWKVAAQGANPLTGKQDAFESDAIWVDLSDVLEGKTVRVLIDPAHPDRHWIDLTDHVGADEFA